MNTLSFITLFVMCRRPVCALSDFFTCHDDFTLKPPDGLLQKNTFGWLGFMQYTHVTTGLPHHSKAPRVILIHKNFVVGPAKDLIKLPTNYKLGNVIFGEYEREEVDCGLTRSQLKKGWRCPPAYLETPILDIITHPEYSRFGVENSLALVKLIRQIKSLYMIPICLPSRVERMKKKKHKFVFMVDYISSVPQDFNLEKMGKKTLKLFTHQQCRRHRIQSGFSNEGVSHVLCTSGCGVRTGAPIVSQNSEGAFELIGLAAGGSPCYRKSMRRRFVKEPPIYMDVFPYITWIINVVTANELPLAYPLYFRRSERSDNGISVGLRHGLFDPTKPQKQGWRARTYVAGNFCYRSQKTQRKAAFFYSEKFEVRADPPASLTVNMSISAGIDCTIVCARLILPNRLMTPVIQGVGGFNITVFFSTDRFPFSFHYTLGLFGRNTTQKNLEVWLPYREGYWS